VTLEASRATARDWLSQIGKGIDPQVELERQRRAAQLERETGFAAVAAEFIKRHVRGNDQRRADIVERELQREFVDRWQDRPITAITARDVVAVIDEVVDRGARAQARNLFGHVHNLFDWAISRGVYGLEHSPCDRLRPSALVGRKLSRQRVLDDSEIRAFWRAAARLGYPYAPLFQLLLLLGQRKSEVAGARWCEFDLPKKLWVIPAERMKSDAAHIVPLCDRAVAILKSLPRFQKGDHLFSTAFGVTPANGFSKAKERLDLFFTEELGHQPPAYVLHDLRRTFRTRLSALRVPTEVAELCIAHAKKGLDRTYNLHAFEHERREAFDAWAAKLRDIIEPPPPNVVGMSKRKRA
jgi:integrase